MEAGRLFRAVGFIAVLGLVFRGATSAHSSSTKTAPKRSFEVDFERHAFLKDGIPFNYVSGSIHYSRVPYGYWRDRLKKMAAAGLDAIQVYIPWNVHEPSPGVYNFDGQQDLVSFINIAQEEGLLVILRGGPYICGEWDFGGIPYWVLQRNGSVVVRTMDPGYLKPVDKWLSVLLPKLRPLLYSAGGPIIMVQVENEYGSYFACDHGYMDHLAKSFRSYLGEDIVLFTTDGDGANFLKCGTHPSLLTTIDFGPTGNVSKAFDVLRTFQPDGPLVNSEFYTGWLDYWGGGHAHGSTSAIVDSLKQTLDLNASINMYMFEGGTNFGYTNGADPIFNICPTSYDYDAPLSEAGDTTLKYMAIRELLTKYKNHSVPVPANTTKLAYGKVPVQRVGGVLNLLSDLTEGKPVTSMYPKTMEQLGQAGGFILYRTNVQKNHPGDKFNIDGLRDRAHIFLDGKLQGLLDRKVGTTLPLIASRGQVLDILVENQGHINFGTQINNGSKGLVANATFGKEVLSGWTMFPLNISKIIPKVAQLLRKPRDDPGVAQTPAIYSGTFQLPKGLKSPADTFLNVSGWFKGQAFINGFNLGRYWPVRGPQLTLYVPATVLKSYPAKNNILLFELDHAPCTADHATNHMKTNKLPRGNRAQSTACFVEFVDKHVLNGPSIPYGKSRASIRHP